MLLLPQVSSVLPIQTPWCWSPQLSWFPLFSPMCPCVPASEYVAAGGKEEVSTMTLRIMVRDVPADLLPLLSCLWPSPTLPSTPGIYIPIFLNSNPCLSPQAWARQVQIREAARQGPASSWHCITASQFGKDGPGIHKYKRSFFPHTWLSFVKIHLKSVNSFALFLRFCLNCL